MLLKQEKGFLCSESDRTENSNTARRRRPLVWISVLDPDGGDFWQCLGLGGQIMLAVPEMDLVVVTTADTQGMGEAEQMILAAVREALLKDDSPENDVEKTTLPVLSTVFEGKHCADFGKKLPLLRNKYGFTWCGVTFSEEGSKRSTLV